MANKRRKGSLIRINGDGSSMSFQFLLNPSTLQFSTGVSWNFIEGQGEYFPTAQFGRIGSSREIPLSLVFYKMAKIDAVGKSRFDLDKGFQREIDLLQSFVEPDVMHPQFLAGIEQGRILRGIAPPRAFFDYGITLHNDADRRQPVEVIIRDLNVTIEKWNARGWPIQFTAQLNMTQVMDDDAAIAYYQKLQRAVQTETGEATYF